MKPYLELVKRILETGEEVPDRTGTGTIRVFGAMEEYDLSGNRIPLITTRKLNPRAFIHEILWFLKGSGNCDYLDEHGVKIWKLWTDSETNSVGPMYPVMLRRWPYTEAEVKEWDDLLESKGEREPNSMGYVSESYPRTATDGPIYKGYVDQLARVIHNIKVRPFSRRHVISYWNPVEFPDEYLTPIQNVEIGNPALTACHCLLQFLVSKEKELSLMVTIRSSDVMVGRPANIFQYGLLCHMVAHVTGLKAKKLVISSGDTHIYLNHVEGAKELIQREPSESAYIRFNRKVDDIDDFVYEDISIENIHQQDAIKFELSQ